MTNYIKGSVREVFFKNDKGFMVGTFKVRDTEYDVLQEYLNKTITFTGVFPDLREDSDYIFYGDVATHPKYGFQFKVENYEQIMPETKNGMISFLSSGIFPGVGLKTATNIVEKLGDNALDLILDNYKNLLMVSSLTEKKALNIYRTLTKEANSYKNIIRLQNIGFSMNEATKIYNQYKDNTNVVIENNIYDLIEDVDGIGFITVDKVAFNLDIKSDDDKRIEACIIYNMLTLCLTRGNIYNNIEDIYLGVSQYININFEIEEFNYYLLKLNKENKIVIEDDKYYLKDFYDAEKNIASSISSLLDKDILETNIDKHIKKLEKSYDIKFNDKQKMAIKCSITKNFLIITGGPGTGKTTIIKAIVDLYQDHNKITKEKLLEDVILLAPTGRAAKRIKEATGFPALTIHRFLKWNKETNNFGINIDNKTNVKFIVVDEVSMIDNFLLSNLFYGLKNDIKMVLVGDYNQLPSVGPGQILKDLIESEVVPVIELNDLYRQKEKSYIVNLAYEINTGQLSDKYEKKQDDYNFIECSKNDICKLTMDICKKAIEKNYSYKDIQVLIPMYKGINGIDMMNNMLQDIFNKKDVTKKEFEYQNVIYREGDKVLQIKNNNDLNISNGDIGIINSISKIEGKDKIMIDFDGELVEYSIKDFEYIKLGYAISIHKAQGSEFDIVIIPMDLSFSRMLYRKLIYTGVTRTKKSLVLIGEKQAFIKSVNNIKEENRKTTLKLFLKNGIIN
ncbi:MAG: ATP-dependent RecD-like DNA helicase [Bacilli bacterium]|nr:ATP-dependent RecD-like DNA helicase [Bacilli bacterium]